MLRRSAGTLGFVVALLGSAAPATAQTWNSDGKTAPSAAPSTAPIPARDLTGLWDAGQVGINPKLVTPPMTTWGEQRAKEYKAGSGERAVPVAEINDPLSTICAPSGFPRVLLFEFRPFQVIQTSNQVLMLYMFEKRWRVIWTDGRELPKDPDPRWYGYSVGKWEDDNTFVVQTIGIDDRTWLDNQGDPHSENLRVEERYRRTGYNNLELTVTITDPAAYTKPWIGRDKLPLRRLPPETDLMEMICSPQDAQEYQKLIAAPSALPAK
jgi:hypothetical protein